MSQKNTTHSNTHGPIVSLSKEQLKGKSLYVIGDIHGCYDELLELEEKARKHAKKLKKTPFFICVGDYCDRGPQSAQVIQHVMEGRSKGTHLGVLGNHEWFFLLVNATLRAAELAEHGVKWPEYLMSCENLYFDQNGKPPSHKELHNTLKQILERWESNGGDLTMKSYGTSLDKHQGYLTIPIEHLVFLLRSPIAIKTPTSVITHAYMNQDHFKSLLSSEQIELPALRWAVDNCLWNRVAPTKPVGAKLWHFSGHTPALNVKRSLKNRWIRLDTGCVYGNKLTAVHLASKKSFSVPAHGTYKEKKSLSPKD